MPSCDLRDALHPSHLTCELVEERPLLYLGGNPSRGSLRRGGTWSPAAKVVHSAVRMDYTMDIVRVLRVITG